MVGSIAKSRTTRADERREVGALQLAVRHVGRNREGDTSRARRPRGARQLAGTLQHPLADGNDDAGLLRDLDEVARCRRGRGPGAANATALRRATRAPVVRSNWGWNSTRELVLLEGTPQRPFGQAIARRPACASPRRRFRDEHRHVASPGTWRRRRRAAGSWRGPTPGSSRRCRCWPTPSPRRARARTAPRTPRLPVRRAPRAWRSSARSSHSTTNSSPPKRAIVSCARTVAQQATAHRDEQLVAGLVAESVVDELEAVEVDEQHGDHRATVVGEAAPARGPGGPGPGRGWATRSACRAARGDRAPGALASRSMATEIRSRARSMAASSSGAGSRTVRRKKPSRPRNSVSSGVRIGMDQSPTRPWERQISVTPGMVPSAAMSRITWSSVALSDRLISSTVVSVSATRT